MLFVGVAGRDELGPINEFIDEFDVASFEHVVDETGSIWADYGIVSQPSFVFLDDSGESSTHVGPLGVDGLSSRLGDLIGN